MRRAITLSLFALACVLTLSGAGTTRPAMPSAADEPAEAPCIQLVTRSHSPALEGGLVVAIWADGTVLFRGQDWKKGPHAVGSVPPEQVAEAMDRIASAQTIDDKERMQIVIDESYYSIVIRDPERGDSRYAWSQHYYPGPDPEANKREERLAKEWFTIRAEIMRLVPIDLRKFEDVVDQHGRFRGFSPRSAIGAGWMGGDG